MYDYDYQGFLDNLRLDANDDNISTTPLVLRDYQKELLTTLDNMDPGSRAIILKSRQVGMTTLLCLYALKHVMTHVNSTVAIVGTDKQSRLSYRNIISDFFDLDSRAVSTNSRVDNSRKVPNEISFINKSKIVFGTNPRSLQGIYPDVIIFDEFAFNRNDRNLVISEFGKVEKGKLIIASSASHKDTEFYAMWEYHSNKKERHIIPWNVVPSRDEQWLKEKKECMSKISFEAEIENKFYEQGLLKEKQIHVRVTEKEREEIESKAKEKGFRQVSEYVRVAAIANDDIDSSPKLCKSYLFLIETGDESLDLTLTSFLRDITIEEDKVKIHFLLDDTNIWLNFLKSKKDFKLWWLDTKGNKIDYFLVNNKNMKVFPLKFSHDSNEPAVAMAIIKFEFKEI